MVVMIGMMMMKLMLINYDDDDVEEPLTYSGSKILS